MSSAARRGRRRAEKNSLRTARKVPATGGHLSHQDTGKSLSSMSGGDGKHAGAACEVIQRTAKGTQNAELVHRPTPSTPLSATRPPVEVDTPDPGSSPIICSLVPRDRVFWVPSPPLALLKRATNKDPQNELKALKRGCDHVDDIMKLLGCNEKLKTEASPVVDQVPHRSARSAGAGGKENEQLATGSCPQLLLASSPTIKPSRSDIGAFVGFPSATGACGSDSLPEPPLIDLPPPPRPPLKKSRRTLVDLVNKVQSAFSPSESRSRDGTQAKNLFTSSTSSPLKDCGTVDERTSRVQVPHSSCPRRNAQQWTSDDFELEMGDELEAVLSMYDASTLQAASISANGPSLSSISAASVVTSAEPKNPPPVAEFDNMLDNSWQDDELDAILSTFDRSSDGKTEFVSKPKAMSSSTGFCVLNEPMDDDFPDDMAELFAKYDATPATVPCDGQPERKYDRYTVADVSVQWYVVGLGGMKQQQKVLQLVDDETRACRIAYLREEWYFTNVNSGDFVHIIARPEPSSGAYVIDNEHGYLILHPDCLISSSPLSEAHGCIRRAVINDRVRRSDGISSSMVFGTMLHELIQGSLQKGDFSEKALAAEMRALMMRNIEQLYCIGETEAAATEFLKERIPKVKAWADRFFREFPKDDAYVTEERTFPSSTNTPVCVGSVIDIEENVWSPMYGLKGQIDASVEVRRREPERNAALVIRRTPRQARSARLLRNTAPLEIKTGKNTTDVAHRAQTMLYTLMMSDRYDVEVNAGYLLYTQTGDFVRVPALRNELRGLINVRNEMAFYLKTREQLPEMKRAFHTCQRCFSLDTCLVYHKATENGTADSSGLRDIFEARTGHITEKHTKFFREWDKYLLLEEADMYSGRRGIWCMSGPEKEKRGSCLSGLSIVTAEDKDARDEVLETDFGSHAADDIFGKFRYRFKRSTTFEADFLTPVTKSSGFLGSRLGIGDPIVVSTDQGQYALATGFMTAMSLSSVTVTLNRPLRSAHERLPGHDPVSSQELHPIVEVEPPPADPLQRRAPPLNSMLASKRRKRDSKDAVTYRIDKDVMSGGMTLARFNLVNLFIHGGDANRRRLVVDLEEPKFTKRDPCEAFPDLNTDQMRAIQHVLEADDYAIILGMPGTGKTTTIAALIQALVARGKSILVTAYTHSAVDNILLKLMGTDVGFLRLGNTDKVHPAIREYTPNNDGSLENVRQLEELYVSKPVVATTILGIGHPLFTKRTFDYCIVDEASQVTLPACLGPLRLADMFVLVGDHCQLPPLVQNPQASGLSVSLFKILSDAHPNTVVNLEHQYRMSADIMAVSNTLVYNQRLKCASSQVAQQALVLPHLSDGLESAHDGYDVPLMCSGEQECWLKHLLYAGRRVLFVDTDKVPAPESRPVDSIVNEVEALLVHQTSEVLFACGLDEGSLGIISPYRAQLKIISYLLRRRVGVEIHTVDKYQGRDKDCIVVSLVRSNSTGQVGELLSDWRRLNVAFTRAKRKLIIFGSGRTLRAAEHLGRFLNLVREKGWSYDLPSGAHMSHTIPSDGMPLLN